MKFGTINGKIESSSTDDNGYYRISIVVAREDSFTARKVIAKIKAQEEPLFTATFEKKTVARSNNANAYFWKLCDEIAKVLQSTKEEIYLRLIKEVGVFQDLKLPIVGYKTIQKGWERQGLGWKTEIVDKGESEVILRVYYGSSAYNTRQMSRLIDIAVAEAHELGIETKTPEEIAEMINVWQAVV